MGMDPTTLLALSATPLKVAEDLRVMDARLFRPGPIGLMA